MDCIINKEFGRYALLDRPNELGILHYIYIIFTLYLD
jgi:hypothetical protein